MAILVPAGASAATWNAKHAPVPFGGPTLLGKRVGWIAPRRDPGGDLYLGASGAEPRRIQRFPAEFKPSSGTRLEYVFELAGSASSVAILRHRLCVGMDPCADRLDIFAGAVGEGIPRIERCQGSVPSAFGIDVSGKLAVFPRCDGRIVVTAVHGMEPDLVLGEQARDAQMAGRYVAWLEYGPGRGGDIVVYDRLKGAVSYVVQREEIGAPVQSLTVQADGKVAFGFNPHPSASAVRARVAWASRNQPHPHRLDLPARAFYFLRFAGNRIAFGRTASTGVSQDTEIGIAGLGGRTQLLTRHAPDETNVDFDGETIAYAERTNHQVQIRTKRLPD